MPVKTPDGLAHVTLRHEDDGHWGRTVCGIGYTRERHYFEALEREAITDIVPAKFAKPPVTCIICLAGGDAS
jgi:hypothetical protein